MSDLVEFLSADNNKILVQVTSTSADKVTARSWRETDSGESGTAPIRRAQQSFEEAVDVVRPVVEALVERLRSASEDLSEVVVEFGLEFSAQAGTFIAKGSAAANFKVAVTWKRSEANTE